VWLAAGSVVGTGTVASVLEGYHASYAETQS
jgi:hypothetical protein